MNTLTRRRFLVASGTAAVAAGAVTLTWRDLAEQAARSPHPVGDKILVVVTLYGGNDGLNTVIPYADPAYHAARPDLAIDPATVLRIGDHLGLNPGMPGLAALYQAKHLAVVRGVGYPQPDHSHFRSMDIWQTASPSEPIGTGWIGRWLDATGDDPVRAINVGTVLAPLVVGTRSVAAALPIGPFNALPADQATLMTGLGVDDPHDSDAAAMVRASYRAERVAAATMTKALDPTATTDPTDPSNLPAASAGGQSDLSQQLDVVARCVKAGVPTRVYAVSLGGFDTHANERDGQQAQLSLLDSALSAFLKDMAGDPHGRSVVAMVYSEFGRRVAANASQGTDHGTAGPVFIAGAPVKGGLYGHQPSLTDLDDGDLKASTDFRVVYAEMLASVLGADPAQVLGTDRPRLGVISA